MSSEPEGGIARVRLDHLGAAAGMTQKVLDNLGILVKNGKLRNQIDDIKIELRDVGGVLGRIEIDETTFRTNNILKRIYFKGDLKSNYGRYLMMATQLLDGAVQIESLRDKKDYLDQALDKIGILLVVEREIQRVESMPKDQRISA